MPLANNIATLRARVSTLLTFSAAVCLALASLSILSAAAASAANPDTYEEAARFGGFDSAAYNGGHYGGALTAGKFVDPTGFAVDTHDASAPNNTALYVVDRTSGLGGEHTSWRLQKLGDEGTVLGSTTFQLPNTPFNEQAGIAGLAVDDSGGEGKVYALVAGNDSSLTGFAYAREVVAWSTTPNTSHELEKPSALGADPLGSSGGLVSSVAQLAPGLGSEHALYDPQGIALDVTSGGAHDLAIEASDGTGTGNSGVTSIPGVAGVWQVATATQGAHHTGDVVGSWSAKSLAGVAPAGEEEAAPYGISANPDGSLSVLLAEAGGVAKSSNVNVVKLSADLASPQMLLDAADAPPDQDQAAVYLGSPPGPFAGSYVAQAPWAGSGLVQLSSGLYAADIEHEGARDPYTTDGKDYYWRSAEELTTGRANVGVRLLLANHAGEISDEKGGTIVNTLGYAAFIKEVTQIGGVCNLDAEGESLAAGANGTLWVLGRGLDSSSTGVTGTIGREIVELTPGSGAHACPQPSGGFKVSSTEVSAGATVEFNADTVNLQGGAPFAYEWDLDNEGFKLVNELGEWVNEDGVEVLSWPPSTATFKYTQPGVYTIALRIKSDYGTYETPTQTLTVTSEEKPVASFTVTTARPTAGQAVLFDASGSTAPTKEATVANYQWEWGDGTPNTQQASPSASHVYAAAGTYPVKLVVTDSNGLKSKAYAASVTVLAPEEGGGGGGGGNGGGNVGGGGGGGGGTTTTTTTSTAPVETGPPNVSPRAAAATGGVVKTIVSCPATSSSCAGTVQVKTATAVAASAAKKKGKKKPKASQLVLGSTSFSLAGGASQTLTIHLSSQGMALLSKSKSLRVLVLVTAHGVSGAAKTETLTLTLHAAVAKKGKKR